MNQIVDTEIYRLVQRIQAGDTDAGWIFAEHAKLKAIIAGRLKQYRRMFYWVPQEDLDDVEHGLRPRLIEIAGNIKLSEMPNDGRIISYFSLRIKGEADYLLKKITGMKQVIDEENDGTVFLKTISKSIDGYDEIIDDGRNLDDDVISCIDDEIDRSTIVKFIDAIPTTSNDRMWLRCYNLKLQGVPWSDIAKVVNCKQSDYSWLKDNTARFVTRFKDQLLNACKKVNYTVCGIYIDDTEVAVGIYNSSDRTKNLVWSKSYDNYSDLAKIENKLGDFFRHNEITYVVTNEIENCIGHPVIMRYLIGREAFVETVDLKMFTALLDVMPKTIGGLPLSDSHTAAYLMTQIKRAYNDVKYSRSNNQD